MIRATPVTGTQFNTSLNVTLSVSPATDIYYTLDGSQASASSTKYTGAINITATTTINTYAKNEVGETRSSFTYTKVDGPILSDWHIYYDNSTTNWGTVNCYAWDDNHQGSNSFTGGWPGKALTETVMYNGKQLYHYSFTPDGELKNPMVIFNGNGSQTGDLPMVNGGIYDFNGKAGDYTDGIEDVVNTPELIIYSQGGQLCIFAQEACNVPLVTLSGMVKMLPVNAGLNTYDLPAASMS